MKYKKCKKEGCGTKLSENSPRYCPKHNKFNKAPLNHRITWLFEKYFVKRDGGNCQILFALTELDDFVEEIMEEISSSLQEGVDK